MNLEQRIAKLERSNRRLRVGFISTGLIAAALLTVAATGDIGDGGKAEDVGKAGTTAKTAVKAAKVANIVHERLQVKKLELLDENGKTVITLSSAPNIGSMAIVGPEPDSRVTIGFGQISVFDKGTKVLHMGASRGGSGEFMLLNTEGEKLVRMRQTTGGDGSVQVLNGNGGTLVYLGATTPGTGLVQTFDGGRSRLVEISANVESGYGTIQSFGPEEAVNAGWPE